MDYYAIGQRIRKFRKALGLSQDALAEKVNISVTHMSHIETGNTKLSLPVFYDIATALNVSADSLLFDSGRTDRGKIYSNIECTLEKCTENELKIINELLASSVTALRKYRN